MRVIALGNLQAYAERHPDTEVSLQRWRTTIKAASFSSMSELQSAFSKAKVLNSERVRFEIAGGNYRLIVAFDF